MAGRCALCLCTALAIAAAASPADGVGQSQGQQVSDDQRPEMVDWPYFGHAPNAVLVSDDRLGLETSAGNSYRPVKSSDFHVSLSDLKRPKQGIDKMPKKRKKRKTTTTTIHPWLKVQSKESWEDRWPEAHSYWVPTPDKKTLKKIEKFAKEEEAKKKKKAEKKKKKKEKKKEKEKKKKEKEERKKPTTTPKPDGESGNNMIMRQLGRRAAIVEAETSRIRDVEVPSGLHEWSQQQLDRVQQSGPHRRSRLPRVLPSADSNSRVH